MKKILALWFIALLVNIVFWTAMIWAAIHFDDVFYFVAQGIIGILAVIGFMTVITVVDRLMR
jgi:hypothetical protein